MTIKTKTCSKCGEAKPLDEFNKDKKGKYGRQVYCRSCVAEYAINREEELCEALIKKTKGIREKCKENTTLLFNKKNKKKKVSGRKKRASQSKWCRKVN